LDNWLIYEARRRLAAVVDITNVVTVVHQNHGHGRFADAEVLWSSEEAKRNRELAGNSLFTFDDATHILFPDGLHSTWTLADFLGT